MRTWSCKIGECEDSDLAVQIREGELYTAIAILGAFAERVRNEAAKEAYIRFGPAPRKIVRKAKREPGPWAKQGFKRGDPCKS